MLTREKLERAIEASEGAMLLLAGLSVVLYILELNLVRLGDPIPSTLLVATLLVDVVFVIDLCVKIGTLGRSYVRSPWFVIDAVSCLPALHWVQHMPAFVESVRFIRAFRLFRVLRSLRLLKVMARLRPHAEHTPEKAAFERVLTVAVLVYAATFLVLMYGLADDPQGELALVCGSVLGMVLVLVVVRYQVREMTATQVRTLLNVALPHQVVRHFIDHPEATQETTSEPATVVFCDFAGFTYTVECMRGDHQVLQRHLESAMDAIVDVHVRHDLIVDKFMGDAIMSFRGGPLVSGGPADHAYRVVRSAIDARKAIEALADPYFNQVKIGGASAGSALIGTFGTRKRLSYTVLGSRVNLAARLEGACGKLGTQNLFCQTTFELTRRREDLRWRRVGQVLVKGVPDPVPAYEAFDSADVTVDWLDRYDDALQLFEARAFAEASVVFMEVDAIRPGGDPPSCVFAAECDRLGRQPLPERWAPALVTGK